MLRSFKQLHNHLQSFTDLADVDTVTFLEPFLHVLESDHTRYVCAAVCVSGVHVALFSPRVNSGPITGLALASVNKFLLYEFINMDSPRAREAVNRIAAAATACRFPPSDADGDAVRHGGCSTPVCQVLRCADVSYSPCVSGHAHEAAGVAEHAVAVCRRSSHL